MEESISGRASEESDTRVDYYLIPKLISTALSSALTGLFAIAGAFTGSITGALAGRASDSGVLRGAGLGALAGAVLSVEVLEASRAYCCQQLSGTRNSSMADFLEELLRGRFAEEHLPPELLTAYHWQVTVSALRPVEVLNLTDEVAHKGLSKDSLKCLPCYEISHETKQTQNICCTICLQVFVSYTNYCHICFGSLMESTIICQDVEVGEIARCLPHCQHTFHQICVDKWLTRHRSCPVCRQNV